MKKIALAAALLLPVAAFAAGGDEWTPPKPSETTKTCKGKEVWDETKKRCVRPKQSSLNQQELMQAVRELAYAGRNADAQEVLAAVPDQNDPLALTYWGFTYRKLGQPELSLQFYQRAIAQDPNHLLARSYMGQGFVEQGQFGLALAQWKEIRARGGTGSWPEVSLRQALETGTTRSY